MSGLKARMRTEGEILLVEFSGRVDIESAPPFRQACRTQLRNRDIVFSFGELSFVGSSGILPFLEVLQDLANENPDRIRFAKVGLEFRRILSATTLARIETWENEDQAVAAFQRAKAVRNTAAPEIVSSAPLLNLKYDAEA